MLLSDLKIRIQESLGLDVISMPGLATSVNNCIASMESKGYREYVEVELDITDTVMPFTVAVPEESKRLVYVKVKTTEGIYRCERIPLTDPLLEARVIDEKYRVAVDYDLVYYVRGTTIYIDQGSDIEIEKIIVGYDKKIPEVPLNVTVDQMNDADNPTEIDIRKDLESAFVFYALGFFANRYSFRPETVDMYNKEYKYFVEDILIKLDREDAYVEDQEITIVVNE